MLMSEMEAKEKRCPHLQAGAIELGLRKGNAELSWKAGACGASDCMMWRWQHTFTDGACSDPECPCHEMEENKGFCGLAGKP